MNVRKFPGHFENRILGILHDDFSKMQSTKLFNEARKPYTEMHADGKTVVRFKGQGPNTTSYYLKRLIKQGRVNRIHDPKHPKDVYYTKNKNVKLVQLSEDIIKETTELLLKELCIEFDNTIKGELAYCEKECPFDNKDEERAFVDEILNSDDELK